MNFDPQKEADGITNESWRPKFFGLVAEGRKFRIRNRAVQYTILTCALIVFGFQLFSALQPSFRRSADAVFTPPQLRSEIVSTYIPEIMNEKRANELERDRIRETATRSRKAFVPIERIKPVSLRAMSSIPAGSEISAALKSGGTNGMVKVELLENLSVAGDVLLPKGTVLLGQGTSSEERLYIAFRKAVLPDKTVTKISAYAYDDKDRMLGLKGKKVSDYAFRLATSAGLIFLGGMADGMRSDTSQNPFAARRPTMRDSALNGVSTATSDMSREVIQGMKNQQERVEVAHSTHLLIIFGDGNENQ